MIAAAVVLLAAVGGFLTLQLFGPTFFRTNLWLWVPNNMMANAAVALAIVGSNDPTGTVAFALPAIMMFQAHQPKFAILFLGWLNGTLAYVTASVVLGVPASHIVTHTWIFAGTSASSVAVVRFLVKEQQRQRTAANGLAALARETAAARTVDEGITRCTATIRELTGPHRFVCSPRMQRRNFPSPTPRWWRVGTARGGSRCASRTCDRVTRCRPSSTC